MMRFDASGLKKDPRFTLRDPHHDPRSDIDSDIGCDMRSGIGIFSTEAQDTEPPGRLSAQDVTQRRGEDSGRTFQKHHKTQ